MMSRTVAKTKLLSVLPGGCLSPFALVYRRRATVSRVTVDELRLMLGSEASREGITLMFDTLQNEHLNRRLVYVLLERLFSTVFADNDFESVWPRLHAKSPRCQAAQV